MNTSFIKMDQCICPILSQSSDITVNHSTEHYTKAITKGALNINDMKQTTFESIYPAMNHCHPLQAPN